MLGLDELDQRDWNVDDVIWSGVVFREIGD